MVKALLTSADLRIALQLPRKEHYKITVSFLTWDKLPRSGGVGPHLVDFTPSEKPWSKVTFASRATRSTAEGSWRSNGEQIADLIYRELRPQLAE
jgi:hypothetical protein